jgi:hypothetical protein
MKQIILKDTSNLLTSRGAERYAGVTRGHFTYLRNEGKDRGPNFLRQATHIFYETSAIDAWLKEKKTFISEGSRK